MRRELVFVFSLHVQYLLALVCFDSLALTEDLPARYQRRLGLYSRARAANNVPVVFSVTRERSSCLCCVFTASPSPNSGHDPLAWEAGSKGLFG